MSIGGEPELRHFVGLQWRRVREVLGDDAVVAAGLRVVVQPSWVGSDDAIRVDIFGASADDVPLAAAVDPHVYLAVRGAFDRLLVGRLRDADDGAPTVPRAGGPPGASAEQLDGSATSDKKPSSRPTGHNHAADSR